MKKGLLIKDQFETTMMIGFGVDGKKLDKVLPELTNLGISFKNYTKFINKQFIGEDLEGWEFIDLKIALDNLVIAKVNHIVTKKVSYFEINPLHLIYNEKTRTSKFVKVKEAIKFFKKHDCFKNKFIRRLTTWLLK